VLYFAYGSNLDEESWELWCKTEGYDPASLEPLGPAWLPDHELVFHYQSRLRRGGALDIQPRRGAVVPGALCRVDDWEGLDAKEGVLGGYYRRASVTALTDDGRAHAAMAYRVCSERIGNFLPPSREYCDMVLRGLSRFGHGCDAFLAVASGRRQPLHPTALFAYGTLMRGEPSHHLLSHRVRRFHASARVAGASLLHLDGYPGLVPSETGSVYGELYELDDIAAVLEALDPYEDFLGYDRQESLYRRSLVRAVSGGGSALAWTYVYLGDAGSFSRIASGRWLGA
jgi:gamma-glutamylcyclotransferase (GGCT)/AIG2-like uncharacterized protein YtfP